MTVAKTRCHVVRKIGKSVMGSLSVCACGTGAGGRRTELGRVEDVLVEDDCAGAERDPCAAYRLACVVERAVVCEAYAM